MYSPVATNDPAAVEQAVHRIYSVMFPESRAGFIARAFAWVGSCFSGGQQGYQAVDATYHDFEHTLQGTLCMARLLHGRQRAGAEPRLTSRVFELGILAILLHDTGYLKTADDRDGTGAKYTVSHVDRSAQFASVLMGEKGFSPAEIQSVQHMIHCTGVLPSLSVIPFQTEIERVVGLCLGTADLLGQMAADDYVEKLPALHAEFAEAVEFSRDQAGFLASFVSVEDLLRKTPLFWEKVAKVKLATDFENVSRFLNDPYPDGPNEYLQRIEGNIDRLRLQFGG